MRLMETCDRARERAQIKIADTERKIEALLQMKHVLSKPVSACSRRRKTDESPTLDSLEASTDPV